MAAQIRTLSPLLLTFNPLCSLIDETGRRHGVRDAGLLASLVQRAQTTRAGKEMYDTVLMKAVVYLHSLAQYHVFVVSNKRTALVATARFLWVNNLRFAAPQKNAEDFVVMVVTENCSIETIAMWLEEYGVDKSLLS